jgi:HTH-type transcriptional regulator, sugar sensing transcriptional regulator
MEPIDLHAAGLTVSEAEVYLRLLEEGSCLASRIASLTKISRPHVYGALNRLIEKGLASFVIRENKRYFSAAEPGKFLSVLKEREAEAEKQRKAIEKIISQLRKIPKKSDEDTIVEVFKGIEGMKTVMDDILEYPGGEQKALGYTGGALRLAPVWWEKWQRARIAARIRRRLIAPMDMVSHPDLTRSMTQARFLPSPYELPVSIVIYGPDKIIFFIPFEKDFVGIRITSAKLMRSYDSHFDMLWRLAERK